MGFQMRICTLVLIFLLLQVDTADLFDYDDEDDIRRDPPWGRCPWLRNKLKNGRVKIRSRGRIAKFSCNMRYELVGKRFATCVGGSWNNPLPHCVSRGCYPPQTFQNGRTVSSYSGALLTFYCSPGYRLEGPSKLYCDGVRWNDAAPICKLDEDRGISCDFESDNLCGWKVDPTADCYFDRVQSSRHEPPPFDHTFGNAKDGHYMYVHILDYRNSESCRLVSPLYPAEYSPACFTFWYNMGRQASVKWSLMKDRVHMAEIQWAIDGHQMASMNMSRDEWYKGTFYIPEVNEPFRLIVDAPIEKHVDGIYVHMSNQIAIDDVSLTHGSSCSASSGQEGSTVQAFPDITLATEILTEIVPTITTIPEETTTLETSTKTSTLQKELTFSVTAAADTPSTEASTKYSSIQTEKSSPRYNLRTSVSRGYSSTITVTTLGTKNYISVSTTSTKIIPMLEKTTAPRAFWTNATSTPRIMLTSPSTTTVTTSQKPYPFTQSTRRTTQSRTTPRSVSITSPLSRVSAIVSTASTTTTNKPTPVSTTTSTRSSTSVPSTTTIPSTTSTTTISSSTKTPVPVTITATEVKEATQNSNDPNLINSTEEYFMETEETMTYSIHDIPTTVPKSTPKPVAETPKTTVTRPMAVPTKPSTTARTTPRLTRTSSKKAVTLYTTKTSAVPSWTTKSYWKTTKSLWPWRWTSRLTTTIPPLTIKQAIDKEGYERRKAHFSDVAPTILWVNKKNVVLQVTKFPNGYIVLISLSTLAALSFAVVLYILRRKRGSNARQGKLADDSEIRFLSNNEVLEFSEEPEYLTAL